MSGSAVVLTLTRGDIRLSLVVAHLGEVPAATTRAHVIDGLTLELTVIMHFFTTVTAQASIQQGIAGSCFLVFVGRLDSAQLFMVHGMASWLHLAISLSRAYFSASVRLSIVLARRSAWTSMSLRLERSW